MTEGRGAGAGTGVGPSGGGAGSTATGTYIFHLIPHTHWDREWFLPRAAFHARLISLIDDLIERLQAEQSLRSFLLDGQTILLEDYLRTRPEREADIRALVKTGRLQVGPCYVLADEQIPSGESLVRNLLLGAADAERLGGRLDVLYSPDAFGHPAVLPTLAREFGIKFGVLWRGLGGEPGQEHDLFRWKGPDGRDIVLWHLPPGGYEIGAELPGSGARLPDIWKAIRAILVQRASGKHVPVFIGADHHAPHPALSRLRDVLAELEPASAFRLSRLDEFFQAAEHTTARAISGELRWSYGYTWTLQGVHGTRAPFKRHHGAVELFLARIAEPLTALARLATSGRDRRPLLETAWRTLVRAQFHDTICGCSADAVTEAAERRLDDVAAYATELRREALHALAGHDPDVAREQALAGDPTLVLWNPAARARGGVVVADVTFFRRDVLVGPPSPGRTPREGPGYRPFALYVSSDGGHGIPVQVLARRLAQERTDATRHYPDQDEVEQVRIAFRAPGLPGLGLAALHAGPAVPLGKGEDVRVRGRSLQNRFVEVVLEQNGAITIVDRRRNERYSELLRLEDAGDAGDAYSYCPPARDRLTQSQGPITLRRLAAGPLVAALETRWEMTRGIDARAVVQLHADSPIVRATLEIDNRNRYHRLRARLPTGLADIAATAGTAFGAVERPPVVMETGAYPHETPVRTAPAHRFVAAARGSRGLAVCAPAFFEYEWTRTGDLLITLLRAIGDLSRDDLPTRPGHAGWPTAIPGAQCIGVTRIDLALAPISAADIERGDVVPHLWEDAFLPLTGLWLRDGAPLKLAPLDIVLEGSGLVFSALKPAQVGSPTVLRCYNATSRKTAGAWRFSAGVKTAHRVRADEREAVALVLEQRGNVVRFVAEPHEIVTIMVT
ncbi:MAG TPA: glycoside hydrolase family 38 C-terminal domain-containing protein [Gemmatimonadales bacterium]|nr:glycoside hydrolase family 38 C-terminal domain-containing protein [Gemmatimonadales bacterium]